MGEQLIVKDGSFHIEDREKAAFVGVNGAGKSTILKMIIGEEPADNGTVVLTKGKTIGYLAQQQILSGSNTIYEEMKTAKADIIDLEEQIRNIEQELKTLSGTELDMRLNTYNRLMSEFESKNATPTKARSPAFSKVLDLAKLIFPERLPHCQAVRKHGSRLENFF